MDQFGSALPPPSKEGDEKLKQEVLVEDEKFRRQISAKVFESSARISLATIGGVLAGYGMGERKRLLVEAGANVGGNASAETGTLVSSSSSASKELAAQGKRRRPPTKKAAVPASSLKYVTAKQWGLSCLLFTLVLETSRLVSPTYPLWAAVFPNGSDDKDENDNQLELKRRPLAAVTDYTLGGSFAGLAGSRSFAAGRPITASFLLRGSFYGGVLGLVGGLVQAAIEVLDVMAEAQEDGKREEEAKEESYYY